MKIRYEMTDRRPGTSIYDQPDDTVVVEAMTDEIVHAVHTFDKFIRSVWGPGWQIILTVAADESPDWQMSFTVAEDESNDD